MEIIRRKVTIKITTEVNGDTIGAVIERQDKFKTSFYNSVSLSSINRLRKLCRSLKESSLEVSAVNLSEDDGWFWCYIVLQK